MTGGWGVVSLLKSTFFLKTIIKGICILGNKSNGTSVYDENQLSLSMRPSSYSFRVNLLISSVFTSEAYCHKMLGPLFLDLLILQKKI